MLYDVCMFVLYLMLVTYRTLSYRIVLSPPRTAEEMMDMLGEATERELDEGGEQLCTCITSVCIVSDACMYVSCVCIVCMYHTCIWCMMYVSQVHVCMYRI